MWLISFRIYRKKNDDLRSFFSNTFVFRSYLSCQRVCLSVSFVSDELSPVRNRFCSRFSRKSTFLAPSANLSGKKKAKSIRRRTPNKNIVAAMARTILFTRTSFQTNLFSNLPHTCNGVEDEVRDLNPKHLCSSFNY